VYLEPATDKVREIKKEVCRISIAFLIVVDQISN
jgi:hypothetical protein